MNTAFSTSLSAPAYQFKSVRKHPTRLEIVKDVFQRVIAPLYGPQETGLQKIEQGTDRKCRLLYEENRAVGLVCYKKNPTNEFAHLGISNSYEIKTLTLIHPEQDSGKGLGSQLLHKIEQSAKKAEAHWMHVTVSENKQESLRFFEKNGFTRVQAFPDLYQSGVTEFLLKKAVVHNELRTISSLETSMNIPPQEDLTFAEPIGPTLKKRKIDAIENATSVWGQSTWGVEQVSQPSKKVERVYKMPIRKQYFDLIRSGQKTVEGRIFSGDCKQMKAGDKILFFCGTNEITRTIRNIHVYDSFAEMLQHEGVGTCLPGVRSVERGVAIYHAIPNYRERAYRSGVVALQLEE